MKNYEITTTSMRKIILSAKNSKDAEKIASNQLMDMEYIMMISVKD